MKKFLRTFIAIKLPEDFCHRVYREFSKFNWQGYKPVKGENIHLTLKFLGKTEEELLAEMNKELAEVAGSISSFSFEIKEFGAFPGKKRARVLWIGLNTIPEELKRLNLEVEDKMSRLGFEKENREYTPHITIGRFKKPQSIEREFEELQSLIEEMKTRVNVNSFYLVKSTLTPAGPIYKDISQFKLK